MGETNQNLREIHIIGHDTREIIVSPRMCPALAAHGISLAGLTEAGPDFSFARPLPALTQILACVTGEGEVRLDGAWAPCPPGSAYVTPPGVAHAYRARPGTRWSVGWVHYETARPDPAPTGGPQPVLRAVDPRPLVSAIEGLYRECMGASEPALLRGWADLLHAYALQMLDPVALEPRLRRLWERVDGDLAFPWDLAALAARAGMGDEHLRRLCRQQLGTSPMRHVRHLRMRRAAVLLESTDCTVQAVAAQVGYENPFAFSTAFKRAFGLPPSQNRK